MTLRSPTVDGEPLFGREAELGAAEWLLAGLADGQGRALVLEGEAGVGKTRLSGAIRLRAAATGMLVLAGGADELERDRPGRILLALAEQLGVSLAASPDEPDAHGGSRGYALIDAVVDAIEDEAVTRLVVVIVEDLHWADELSLRGLAALVQRLAPLPVALVATRRPSPVPQSLPRVLARLAEAGGRELRIRGLNEEAVGSLISAVSGSRPGPRLAARVRAAAGNPLFVIELLRALDAEGALHVEHGSIETDERALPLGMRDAVTRRLSILESETVELLRLATLLGTEFAVADLAIVAGRSVIDVAAHLREPLDAQVLKGAGDNLAFRHDLIREAIYDDMVTAVRRDLHREAGDALAAARAPVAQVARQFALGGRHGDLVAVDWLERAADEVLGLDHGTAVALYEQALALAPAGWAGLTRIQTALLEPLAWCGRVDDARLLAQSLLDRAVSAADEFAIRQGLGAVLATAGDLASAAAENEAAAAVVGTPPHEERILRCLAAGEALLAGRSPEEVRAVAAAAIAEAGEAMDDSLASVAHLALGLAAGAFGDHQGALEHVRASRRSVDAGRIFPRGFVFPQVWEGTFQFYLDHFDDAIRDYAVLQRRAERRGEPGLLVHTHSATAAIHFLAGRWDDAIPEIEAAMPSRATAEPTGSPWSGTRCKHASPLVGATFSPRTRTSRPAIS